ncbi:hypothetical protein [Hugenholtzia roseola]|uniref:hypothetical protein n=1 Tax=Hugenholtzia roseola TaxID=1002 RepID=UPI0004022EE3|nr:hypothetical protein [Hugenholtzia roseola]
MIFLRIITILLPTLCVLLAFAGVGFWYNKKAKAKALARKLSDANLISEVARAGGSVTASHLCLLLGVDLGKAQERLEDLYAKGVFETDFLDNGTVRYTLSDKNLHQQPFKGNNLNAPPPF